MKIVNRSYHREFEALETFEAGIALTGPEVKVIREGGLRLDGSFVKITGEGAVLHNAEIPAYKYAPNENYDSKRNRKLLLHQEELERLRTKISSQPGLTIVPISCYNKRSLIKLEIALSRGRKDLEKRKREKTRDIKRNEKREAKEYMKE